MPTTPLAALAHEVRLACAATSSRSRDPVRQDAAAPRTASSARSPRYDSPVKAVPLLAHDEVLAAATETAAPGASEFCLVYAVRPRRAADGASRGGRALIRRETASTWRSAPASSTTTRPVASPPPVPTATTTTSRPPGRTSAHRDHPLVGGAVRHQLVRQNGMESLWRCWGWGNPRQRIELLGQLRQGPAEVPRPSIPARNAAAVARWWRRGRRSAGSRCSGLALPDVILRYARRLGGHAGRPAGDGDDGGHQRPDRRQSPTTLGRPC